MDPHATALAACSMASHGPSFANCYTSVHGAVLSAATRDGAVVLDDVAPRDVAPRDVARSYAYTRGSVLAAYTPAGTNAVYAPAGTNAVYAPAGTNAGYVYPPTGLVGDLAAAYTPAGTNAVYAPAGTNAVYAPAGTNAGYVYPPTGLVGDLAAAYTPAGLVGDLAVRSYARTRGSVLATAPDGPVLLPADAASGACSHSFSREDFLSRNAGVSGAIVFYGVLGTNPSMSTSDGKFYYVKSVKMPALPFTLQEIIPGTCLYDVDATNVSSDLPTFWFYYIPNSGKARALGSLKFFNSQVSSMFHKQQQVSILAQTTGYVYVNNIGDTGISFAFYDGGATVPIGWTTHFDSRA